MIKILETKMRDKNGIIVGSSKYEAMYFPDKHDFAVNIFNFKKCDLFIKKSGYRASTECSVYSSEASYLYVSGNKESTKCVILDDVNNLSINKVNKEIEDASLETATMSLLHAKLDLVGKTDYILDTYKDDPATIIYYLSKYKSSEEIINIISGMPIEKNRYVKLYSGYSKIKDKSSKVVNSVKKVIGKS